MSDTAEIRQRLTTRRDEISARLSRITRDVRHSEEPLDADFAEQAVERENDEVLTALDNTIRAELAQLEQTLQRLDAGAYGMCQRCGEPIAEKRLQALPYAVLCIACAAA
mgnify:CR=1 FL=1